MTQKYNHNTIMALKNNISNLKYLRIWEIILNKAPNALYQFYSHQSVISFSLLSYLGQNHLVKKNTSPLLEKSSLYENTHHHENFLRWQYYTVQRKRKNREGW